MLSIEDRMAICDIVNTRLATELTFHNDAFHKETPPPTEKSCSEYDIKCPHCGKVKNICKYENRVCDECEDKYTQSDEDLLKEIIRDYHNPDMTGTVGLRKEILKHFVRKDK